MPPHPPTDTRATDDRATDYGDRAVAAGDRATATPAAPGAGKAPAPAPLAKATPRTAEIILIDPKGLLTSEVQKALPPALTGILNGLYTTTEGKLFVSKGWGTSWSVRYQKQLPSQAQRGAFGALQYPIYYYNGHTSDAATVKEIEGLMRDHGIREKGVGAQQYKEARDGWASKDVEGLGIQPLEGYRKVGFIKADQIYASRGDFGTLFRNITQHELGHMFNMKKHGDAVMRSGVLLSRDDLGYSHGQALAIMQELTRLIVHPEADLQAAYERANR